ncbi:hypothetical protein BD311DRAFT_261552 [Dichomitus squalens]|uniref:Uncharacterized protein n=1 Tax=Dichomitus squalens TaxID=114155 RepID=A0A4Q9MTN7_9APHY|nr:hypothetical protein BD311DRAFT_261552 [Dichomitus squalens]
MMFTATTSWRPTFQGHVCFVDRRVDTYLNRCRTVSYPLSHHKVSSGYGTRAHHDIVSHRYDTSIQLGLCEATSAAGHLSQITDTQGWEFHSHIAEKYISVVKLLGFLGVRQVLLKR